MFIETHNSTTENGKPLAFLQSSLVQAYPCGSRRSTLIDNQYYIPFDPEAKLNTETTNRKQSSLNGFTQTFLKEWESERLGELSLVIAGYFFKINLSRSASGYVTPNEFAADLLEALSQSSSETVQSIYANIRIKETKLFSDFTSFDTYYTNILVGQTDSSDNSGSIDILRSAQPDEITVNSEDPNNYYFSGISFSTDPLATPNVLSSDSCITEELISEGRVIQQVVSFEILKKIKNEANDTWEWQINQRALLPKIEHGELENSVKIGCVDITTEGVTVNDLTGTGGIINASNINTTDITTTNITAEKIIQNGKDVPIIALENKGSSWQLQITNVMKLDSNN